MKYLTKIQICVELIGFGLIAVVGLAAAYLLYKAGLSPATMVCTAVLVVGCLDSIIALKDWMREKAGI